MGKGAFSRPSCRGEVVAHNSLRYMPDHVASSPTVGKGRAKDEDLEDGSEDHNEMMVAVEGVCSANRAARLGALASLSTHLRLRCDDDEVQKYASTLANALFNCMRRGKCDERCRAATAAALMAWVLEDADTIFDKTRRYAERILTTEIKKGEDYSDFVIGIAVIYFIESPDPYDVLALCRLLLSSAEHQKSGAHREACLSAWTFLFSTVPPADLGGSAFVEAALEKMHACLFDDDTAVRVAAGESITMMFVRCNLIALTASQDAVSTTGALQERAGLDAILQRMREIEKNMAEDHRKSKSDRAEQRRQFKEYLRIIAGELPRPQRVVLPNGQTLEVDRYEDLIFLNMTRRLLADGFLLALSTNRIMHNVLDFEPMEFAVERFDADNKTRREKQRMTDRRNKACEV